jgi:hypothetical protein
VDLTVAKTTRINERLQAQFRFEAFNVFNHANFALPAASVFSATGRQANAGQITNVVTSARQIQLALKLVF